MAHEPSKGDGPWGLGCRVYERTVAAIARAAFSKEHREWLSVVERSGLLFVFGVGGVPLRFYSGDAENPPSRAARVFAAEAEQISMLDLLPQIEQPGGLYCRIIVTCNSDLDVGQVTFLQVDGNGHPHNPYSIPLDETIRAIPPQRRPGVALAPPRIGPATKPAESGDAAN